MEIDPNNYAMAHRAGGGFALVPKSVAAAQKHHDENRITFGAIPCDHTGKPHKGAGPFRARVRGDLYDLHGSGTGDMVVGNA